jgi:hypothetical protein
LSGRGVVVVVTGSLGDCLGTALVLLGPAAGPVDRREVSAPDFGGSMTGPMKSRDCVEVELRAVRDLALSIAGASFGLSLRASVVVVGSAADDELLSGLDVVAVVLALVVVLESVVLGSVGVEDSVVDAAGGWVVTGSPGVGPGWSMTGLDGSVPDDRVAVDRPLDGLSRLEVSAAAPLRSPGSPSVVGGLSLEVPAADVSPAAGLSAPVGSAPALSVVAVVAAGPAADAAVPGVRAAAAPSARITSDGSGAGELRPSLGMP